MLLSVILYRKSSLVCARSWIGRLDGRVFAIGHLRLEYFVLARRVKLLLSQLIKIVDAWARIVSPWLVVVLIICLLEQSAIHLAEMELVLWELRMNFRNLWSVCCGSDLIEAATGVRCGSQLPCGNTRSHCVRNHSMVLVLLWFVLQVCLITRSHVAEFTPLGCFMVVSRVGVVQVCRALNKTWSRSSWTKSVNLCKKSGIVRYRSLWKKLCRDLLTFVVKELLIFSYTLGTRRCGSEV